MTVYYYAFYVWLCRAIDDYVWLYMTLYDYLWPCTTKYDYVWLYMPMYDCSGWAPPGQINQQVSNSCVLVGVCILFRCNNTKIFAARPSHQSLIACDLLSTDPSLSLSEGFWNIAGRSLDAGARLQQWLFTTMYAWLCMTKYDKYN